MCPFRCVYLKMFFRLFRGEGVEPSPEGASLLARGRRRRVREVWSPWPPVSTTLKTAGIPSIVVCFSWASSIYFFTSGKGNERERERLKGEKRRDGRKRTVGENSVQKAPFTKRLVKLDFPTDPLSKCTVHRGECFVWEGQREGEWNVYLPP